MYLSLKLTMCFLFITTLGNILPLALLQKDPGIVLALRRPSLIRVRRQGPVVQPSWVPNSEISLFEDFNVRVTDEKLEETEAIREYIQETVDNGTYVVELDEGDFEEDDTRATDEEAPAEAEELAEPAPELVVEPKSETSPAPKIEPVPEPVQKPIPNEKPSEPNAHKTTAGPYNFFENIKVLPKRNGAKKGRPFFIWLRKTFNRS